MNDKIAIAAGAVIISAAAHVSIVASGGYAWQTSPLPIAVALGLIVGAICVGRAWQDRRFGIAWCLIAALAAGEAFAIIATGERIVTTREAAQAPIRNAEQTHAKARQRVADAEAALAGLPTRSDRLKAALAAKEAANAAAVAKAAEKNCLVNCRALLQSQVDAAATEVTAARDELAAQRTVAEREIASAREVLAGLKPPASATPLADRLGIAGWALDLISAALGSCAANGLGAALVAFGAHGRREHEKPAETANKTPAANVAPPNAPPAPSAHEHAAKFGREMLTPADTATPMERLYDAYLEWCHDGERRPFPPREIGSALSELLEGAGLSVQRISGAPHVVGATLKIAKPNHMKVPMARRRALGPMTRKTA